MAINIESESVVSLTEATRIIPPRNGKRVAISTLWRWCRKGINDVRLEYIRLGRNIATSQEALGRFFCALAEADKPARSLDSSGTRPAGSARRRPTPPAARRASLEQADRILERAGI
jgi:hypothetical protein